MNDQDKNRAGLGKVIYSVDEPPEEKSPDGEQVTNEQVQEADEESFPASDPPGFAGASNPEGT